MVCLRSRCPGELCTSIIIRAPSTWRHDGSKAGMMIEHEDGDDVVDWITFNLTAGYVLLAWSWLQCLSMLLEDILGKRVHYSFSSPRRCKCKPGQLLSDDSYQPLDDDHSQSVSGSRPWSQTEHRQSRSWACWAMTSKENHYISKSTHKAMALTCLTCQACTWRLISQQLVVVLG